jgi:hypothetical protein
MGTLIKKFNFKSDTEGWAFHCMGPGYAKSRWKRPRPTYRSYSGLGFDFVGLGGGSLSSSVANGSGGDVANNYWEWSGLWSDLGVPSGARIISVDAAYSYRWMCTGSRSGSNPKQIKVSSIVLSAGDAKTGPFELRDNSGILIDTFSDAVDCPARTGWTDWGKWPLPNQDNPAQEVPSTWAQPAHSSILVPSNHQTSGSQIKLRLNNILPQAPNNDPGISFYYIALKNDNIVLTIEYDLWTDRTKPTTTYSGRTKPATSFTNRTKPTSIWTDRIEPNPAGYDNRFGYLIQEISGYVLQENGFKIIVKGIADTVSGFVNRVKPITSWGNNDSFALQENGDLLLLEDYSFIEFITALLTPWTDRSKPSTAWDKGELYLLQENGDLLLLEDYSDIELSKINTPWGDRSQPETTWVERAETTSTWTNRIKP